MASYKFKFDPTDSSFILSQNGSVELVILLHASGKTVDSLSSIKQRILQEIPQADLWLPNLPTARLSFESLTDIAYYLVKQVDVIWNYHKQNTNLHTYERITFIGHSVGALLARKVYIYSCGENKEAPFEDGVLEKRPREWASKVDRLILLAGMNRGWSVQDLTIASWITIKLNTGIVLGEFLMFFTTLLRFRKNRLLIFQVKKGASFITQLRIQWLAMARALNKLENAIGGAAVIQLLGTIDDMVSPEDNIDLVTGRNFFYLEVPKSGHYSVVVMDDSIDGQMRFEKLYCALTNTREELNQLNDTPLDLLYQKPDEKITDVIFVIHGIRDKGFWTQKIARRIKKEGEKLEVEGKNGTLRKFAVETSTYGYFAMIPFILPWTRRDKVEWLMDKYAEDLALYPNADFSYVGHSNGTYLLSQALKEYPACHFKNVVFAGSVVPVSYNWNELLQSGRVKAVLNYVATSDWVVAIFPKFFQMLKILGIKDIGSAGHDGFTDLDDNHQIRYIEGGHGAAIQEDMWNDIKHFALLGEMPTPEDPGLIHTKQSNVVKSLGKLPPLIWILIISFLTLLGWLIWHFSWPEYHCNGYWSASYILKALTLLIYIRILWFVGTKL